MTWAFELLGLPLDADAASIKRAYAKLLRSTRPDENPEAFQRLHIAYKIALAQAAMPAEQEQASVNSPISAGSPAVSPTGETPGDATPDASVFIAPTGPAVDIGRLANEVIRAAMHTERSPELEAWLQARQEFWPIAIKQQTGQLVIHRLFQQPQAMSPECLEALLHFFDLDHVLSGINPVALQQLRQQQLTLWELVPDNHRLLALRMRRLWGQQPDTLLLGDDIALLQRPFRWLAALRAAVQIGRTRELGRLALTLSNKGHLDQLPPSINRQHTQFWLAAAAPRGAMTWPRFAIGSFRAALAALAAALIVLGLVLLMPGNSNWQMIAALPSCAAIGTFCIWLLIVGCAWFDHWQGLPESTPSRLPWLRRLAIPVLCACSVALCETTTSSYAMWTTVLVCVFAVRRFRRRLSAISNMAKVIRQALPAVIFVLIVILNPLMQALRDGGLALSEIIAGVAMCVWAVDMTRHRAYLRLKFARG